MPRALYVFFDNILTWGNRKRLGKIKRDTYDSIGLVVLIVLSVPYKVDNICNVEFFGNKPRAFPLFGN